MAIANIVHSGYGFHCTATDHALPLALGLDGSAVLERLKGTYNYFKDIEKDNLCPCSLLK